MPTQFLYGLYDEHDTCLFIGRSICTPCDWKHGLKNKEKINSDITRYLLSHPDSKYIVKQLLKVKYKLSKNISTQCLLEYHEKLKPKFLNQTLYRRGDAGLLFLRANYADGVLLNETS